MNNLDEMQTFVWVVEDRSITKTADRLEVSKSVVSRRLQALERRLKVRLLNRSTRRLALTDAGRLFYSESKDILARVDALEDRLARRSGEVSGTLRLSAPVSFGIQYLTQPLSGFLADYPALHCDVEFSDRYVDLVAEGFDCALRIGELKDSSLVARKIAASRRIACASPEYLDRNGRPRTPAELKHHCCIVYAGAGVSLRFRGGGQQRPQTVKVKGRLRTNNGEMQRAAAERGLGIIVLPQFFLHESLRQGRLEQILPDYALPDVGIYLVFPHAKFMAPSIRALIDFLVAELGNKTL